MVAQRFLCNPTSRCWPNRTYGVTWNTLAEANAFTIGNMTSYVWPLNDPVAAAKWAAIEANYLKTGALP